MAKKKQQDKPKVAKELEGLELNIDSFGEIQKSLPIDKINEFLNKKVDDKKLYAYGVYQIESGGKDLFLKIDGEEDSIMGLPIKKIKEYLNNLKW